MAVFAAHRQELADEQEEGAAILESLERLRLPDSGTPEALYEALCRAEDEGAALPPRDLEPDFGRFDELTREERAELSRRAIVAGSVGLWIHWETGSVGCAGIIGQDVVFSDTAWDEEAGAVVARFEATLLGDGETGEYCLPLTNTEAGYVLSKSILPGETYAGFS